MKNRRTGKLKNLLEELAPEQIDYQSYMDELESQWATDTFFRGRILALDSYLKLLKREDLSLTLNNFIPINGNAIEALTFISEFIRPEILDYLERDVEVDVNDPADLFWDKDIPIKIFLSYSWKNSGIADTLEILFHTKGIILERDIRDVDYKQSIKEFMKKIRQSDYCLMIISKNYLESINCMFEVTEFIKDESYVDRILPLVQNDVGIFDILDRNKYIKFWQDKFQEVQNSLSDLNQLNRVETINELKKIENIERNIGEFLSIISEMKTVTFDHEIIKSDFDKIYSVIYPSGGFLCEYLGVEGYFVLNIPRTLTDKVFVWMKQELKGYTDELNYAKVYTLDELEKKIKSHPSWFNKKFAAIPINKVAIKLGQNYIPLNGHFLDILRKHKDYIIGNKDIYLNNAEIEQHI